MFPRDDLDGQATNARARRRPDDRNRRAGRLVARAEWLSDALVFWTGQREDVARIADTLAPLGAVLQDRMGELPAGLYAVRAGFAEGGSLALQVTSVEAVTNERLAATARAIEAAGRFPRAAARFVGSVPAWRARAMDLLEDRRRAVEGGRAWRAGAVGALAVEARAFWLGAGRPPSSTLSDEALAASCRDSDSTAARLAAVALGRRRNTTALPAALAAWRRAGRALDRWPSATIARAAAAFGPTVLAKVAAGEALNHPLAAVWAEERALDPAAGETRELAGLARLLSAIHAVGEEPARRHGILCRLAPQYLQIVWGRGSGPSAPTMEEVAGAFRGLVIDQVYGSVRDVAEPCRSLLAGSMIDLGERWVGELLGPRLYAYIDGLMASASAALGNEHFPFPDDPPASLSEDVASTSALDFAGAASAVVGANRLRWKGAPGAGEAVAAWIDTCRPVVPLGRLWRDVLAVLPPAGVDGARARAVSSSLDRYGRELAFELAFDGSGGSDEIRTLLPAVLARGPLATGRVLRHRLWLCDQEALDSALRWLDEVERTSAAPAGGGPVPVPRQAFEIADVALRDTVLAVGMRVWADGFAGAGEVERLLAILARQVPRRCPGCWTASADSLVKVAPPLVRRVLRRSADDGPGPGLDGGLVHAVLEACARWASAGFGDVARLARILADRWKDVEQADEEWSPHDGDRNDLVVRLSEGRIPRMLALLSHPSAPRQYPWRAADGWALVQKHARARKWISACLDRPEIVPRVARLLERIALLARLEPGLTAARLFAPLDQPDPAAPAWGSRVPADACDALGEIARARRQSGAPEAIPGALRRSLDRAAAGDREGPALRELARVLNKQLAFAGLAALESLVSRDLARRWRRVLRSGHRGVDGPGWDNALHMLLTVEHNRRILARLLRRAAEGERIWMRDLEPNKAFLAALEVAGLRSGEWLAERSLVVATPGGSLTAYAATDPLEILQMGSLFGTCLSAGKFNAHAAVAAAVEVNKRVLYVKDGRGRVLGRRLLALTTMGEVIGFTTYGSGADGSGSHGAWVKLALELLALEIVRACGASLMPAARVASGLSDAEEEALMLFCRGYVDTPEPFDWWIEGLAATSPGSTAGDRQAARSLLASAAAGGRDLASGTTWQREQSGWATCRALLWLGADAPPLSTEQETALGITATMRAHLTAAYK